MTAGPISPDVQIKFVFLDRDGVLNKKPPEGHFVRQWSEFEWINGSKDAIVLLKKAHKKVFLITNQRGIALGHVTHEDLHAINDQLQRDLKLVGARIDRIYYCPHNKGECQCRKPATGMLDQAFADFPEANPGNCLLIGDSLSDIVAGRTLGIPTIFIIGERSTRKVGFEKAKALATVTASSLMEAVNLYILPHRL
jgi:D-glycero-D-manno-heptose 1,7-bisphosphate phosphatase